MITGFTAIVSLAVWGALVLLHGVFRSLVHTDPDPIRPSGPTTHP